MSLTDEGKSQWSSSPSRRWIAGLCLACAALIAVQTWSTRLSMYPDGISYLDMADKFGHGDFGPLAHSYWSPLYPLLLMLIMKLFPGPAIEFQLVHLANAIIGLAGLASFTYFLRQFLRNSDSISTFRARTGFAYVLFLWGTLEAINLSGSGPDASVAALVYFTAGLCCRLGTSAPRQSFTSALLGLTLGLSCLAKGAMAPLSIALFVLLATPLISIPKKGKVLAIGLAAFALVVAPYFGAISLKKHQFSMGDSGKLNYAWSVSREIPMFAGWTGQQAETGRPQHPPRILNTDPLVLEFADTVGGTYPLWYDPAYFHDGLKIKFDAKKQLATLLRSMNSLRWAFGTALYPMLAGLLVLGLTGPLKRASASTAGSFLFWWPVAAFGLFALVVVLPRYVAPFMVLSTLVIFDSFEDGSIKAAYQSTIGVVAICILLLQIHGLVKTATDQTHASRSAQHLVAARQLSAIGIKPGDEIATIGGGFNAYYASLARLRIVANIGYSGGETAEDDKPALTDESKFAAAIAKLHVKAIVSGPNALVSKEHGWRHLGDTDFWVLVLKSDGIRDYRSAP